MQKKNFSNLKINVSLDFRSVQSISSVSAQLCFKDMYFVIKLTDNTDAPNSKIKKKDLIKSIIMPIYNEQDEIIVNYCLMYKIVFNNNRIVFDVLNPNNPTMFNFEFYNFNEPGIFRNLKYSTEQIQELNSFFEKKKVYSSKNQIETLFIFFNCLKDAFINQTIIISLEEKYLKSMLEAKKYYQAAIVELKKTQKVKTSVKSNIMKQQKKDSSKIVKSKIDLKKVNQTTLNDKNISYPHNHTQNEIRYNHEDILQTIIDDTRKVIFSNFEELFIEIKKKSIYSIETSIIILFQILGFDNNNMNLKNISKGTVAKQLKYLNYKEEKITSKMKQKNNLKEETSEPRRQVNGLQITTRIDPEIDEAPKTMEIHKGGEMKKDNLFDYKIKKKEKFKEIEFDDQKISDDRYNPHTHHPNNMNTLEDNQDINFEILIKTQGDRKEINDESIKVKQKTGEETPKFYKKNKKKSNDEKILKELKEIDNNAVSLIELTRMVDETKSKHLFLPPNSYDNVIFNSVEICHRRFFELCFEDYFPKIFSFEKDKVGIIKIESILSYFYYIKSLKNFLFTDENKIFYANLFFYEDN